MIDFVIACGLYVFVLILIDNDEVMSTHREMILNVPIEHFSMLNVDDYTCSND